MDYTHSYITIIIIIRQYSNIKLKIKLYILYRYNVLF